MKQFLPFLLFLGFTLTLTAQEQQFKLKKGTIIDSLRLNDSIPETFSLYLPTKFENSGKWPVVFVFDLKGRAKHNLRLFKAAAEKQQYILAASNNLSDTLSLSQNILIAGRMFDLVSSLFPIHKDRVYTAGIAESAKVASLAPAFIKEIDGVISLNSAVPNTEIFTAKNSFHFVGIVGKEDFNYVEMLEGKKTLNKLKFPNNLLSYEGGQLIPDQEHMEKALEILTLAAMAKGNVERDTSFIKQTFERSLNKAKELIDAKKMVIAYDLLVDLISIYRSHMDVDTVIDMRKTLKKDKLYRAQRRAENYVLFRESFIKDDYDFNLLEDVSTINYNNLGWWNYQMKELKEYEYKPRLAERQMGKRLLSYLNALVEDNIDIELAEPIVNDEKVSFLWMLKTITDPKDYSYYLKIISDSARYEDFGTALFYLEELLKNGYKNKAELYALDHTALLRITPEFNKIVDNYLKDARYDLKEQ